MVRANRTVLLRLSSKVGDVADTVESGVNPMMNAVDIHNGYVLGSPRRLKPYHCGPAAVLASHSHAWCETPSARWYGRQLGLGNAPIWANGGNAIRATSFLLNDSRTPSNLVNGNKSTRPGCLARVSPLLVTGNGGDGG